MVSLLGQKAQMFVKRRVVFLVTNSLVSNSHVQLPKTFKRLSLNI